MTRPLWHEAADLAARVHRHQLRRDGRTPYIAHPSRVALVVAAVFEERDPDLLAAAYLHDVIEDADVDYDEIHERFGPAVADLCAALTKDMRLAEAARERAYDEQLARAPWPARLLKLADVYDNLSDMDPTDAAARRKVVARAERALALAAGDERLARACSHVRELARAAGAAVP